MTPSPSIARKRSGGMIFVEGFRLLFVLGGAVAGYEIGQRSGDSSDAPVVGLLLGAAISYVVGGVVGRLLDRGLQHATFLFRNTPPGEIFAAAITATTGMLLGFVLGLPVLVIVHSGYGYGLIVIALASWVFGTLGWRVGSVKGRQIVAAAGLSRILTPHPVPAPRQALLVDSSALMDRFLFVLGRGGLLTSGLFLPQFVVDHLKALAEAPDPVSSRRALRGLESVEALRELGVPVHLVRDEVPEVDDPVTKLLTVARRVGLRVATCSSIVVDEAARWDVGAVDLREVANGLTPDHLPGEHLEVALVREGRQPRQAIGYLPDGDMVVVNDAAHVIDTGPVSVSVLSTRSTSQGVMVFAKLQLAEGLVTGSIDRAG